MCSVIHRIRNEAYDRQRAYIRSFLSPGLTQPKVQVLSRGLRLILVDGSAVEKLMCASAYTFIYKKRMMILLIERRDSRWYDILTHRNIFNVIFNIFRVINIWMCIIYTSRYYENAEKICYVKNIFNYHVKFTKIPVYREISIENVLCYWVLVIVEFNATPSKIYAFDVIKFRHGYIFLK